MKQYHLQLYITGHSLHSQQAIANLKSICAEVFQEQEYDLQIIDVLTQPQLAEDERILATPTVVKSHPPPQRRVIGDLNDRELVMKQLLNYFPPTAIPAQSP